MKSKKHLNNNEAGAIIILLTLALIPIIGILALVIDSTGYMESQLQREANAEYAAQVAIFEFVMKRIDGSTYNEAFTSAQQLAENSLPLNNYFSHSGGEEKNRLSITFGIWDGTSFIEATAAGFNSINSARVLLDDTSNYITFFASIVGVDKLSMKTEAIAEYNNIRTFNMIMPLVIAEP